MLQSYLSKRKQKTKINDAYSEYCEILFGVPQRSILVPLLFNIYICVMFYDINDCDIASYGYDNTPYASSNSLDALKNKLEESTNNLFQWFRNNHMKANADKYHLNNRINKIYERALGLVYQNKSLSFSELLELGNAVTIHQRNLQVLVTEIFKVKNNLSPKIKKQIFDFQ